LRTKERVKKYGEVLTPIPLVNEILDHLPEECWIDGEPFLDPCCGNGNFLVEVLKRKIELGHKQLHSVYGIELLENNCEECRQRLQEIDPSFPLENIHCADALTVNPKELWNIE